MMQGGNDRELRRKRISWRAAEKIVALLAAAVVVAVEWSTSYLTRQTEHARQAGVSFAV